MGPRVALLAFLSFTSHSINIDTQDLVDAILDGNPQDSYALAAAISPIPSIPDKAPTAPPLSAPVRDHRNAFCDRDTNATCPVGWRFDESSYHCWAPDSYEGPCAAKYSTKDPALDRGGLVANCHVSFPCFASACKGGGEYPDFSATVSTAASRKLYSQRCPVNFTLIEAGEHFFCRAKPEYRLAYQRAVK